MKPIPIDSLDDPRLAPYRNVRDAHLLKDLPTQPGGLFMAEGEVVVRTLIRSAFKVHSLLLTPTRLETMRDAVEDLAPGTPVYLVEQGVMDGVTGFHIHRGVLAAGVRKPPPALEDLLRTPRPLVVLEDLANHDNVGGVFRNAGAFGAGAVLLSPRCTDPQYRKALRVSAGQVLGVPFGRVEDWPKGLERVRAAGFRLAALVTDQGAAPLGDWVAGAALRTALIVGSEGGGLTEAVRARADDLVRIPMAPGVDSLNAAVAVAVALQRLTEARIEGGGGGVNKTG